MGLKSTPYLRLHDYTTVGVAPLDCWTALPSELYFRKLNIHKRQTLWPGEIRAYYPRKRATSDRLSSIWKICKREEGV